MKAKITDILREHNGKMLTVIFLESEGLTAVSPDPLGGAGSPDVLVNYRYSEVELIPEDDWDRGFERGMRIGAKKLKRSNLLSRFRRRFRRGR